MEVKKTIEIMLLQFLSGEISKEALYGWAVNILHKMLKGDIFEIKNLEIWGIITKLVEVSESDIDDRYCTESVHNILNVLSGEECDVFSFVMQIPQKYIVNNLLGLDKLINKYYSDKPLLEDEIQNLKLLSQKKIGTCSTINSLLEFQIIEILKLGYTFFDENNLKFDLKSSIFISEEAAINFEERVILKVSDLYKCYKGEKSFFVSVLYNNGIGNVSIQV
ncbi:MAG: hypothetical protein K2O32_07935 [Acetatifactor sp.]|nr:hypothetical protein [Acetatifactor sp.]